MTRHKARSLLAALLWLALWPAPVQSQSAALMDAYNQFSGLHAQGRYQEALPYAEEALRLGEAEFGPDNPTTATLLNNLAVLYHARGRYAEAEPLYERSLAIWKKTLGPEHPNVVASLESYAALQREAEREEMEARAEAVRATSPESPAVARIAPDAASRAGETQTAALPLDRFDGRWQGQGKNSTSSPRKRCGIGPTIKLTVHEGRVSGKLVLIIAGYNADTEVVPFDGTVDEEGRLLARGHELRIEGTLPDGNKPGKGTWNVLGLSCKGRFQVTRTF